MIEFSDECVGCPPEIGCFGDACVNKNVPHFICDYCDEEVSCGELFEYDNKQLCINCIKDRLKTVDYN